MAAPADPAAPPAPTGPFGDLLGTHDDEVRVRLPVFEGPLDLLLFLIRRNEIDIHDIPIAKVTLQYLEVLRSLEHRRVEIAGEFFVMAATLMEIKSRLLLPRDLQPGAGDEEEPGADPRWELVHQLLEYRKFKDAAGTLGTLIAEHRDVLPVEAGGLRETEPPTRVLQPVDRLDLWATFNLVLRRLAGRLVVGEIRDETVTIVERMEHLLQRLREEPQFGFTTLFPGPTSFVSVVVTFLAVLELTRLKRIRVRQEAAFAEIVIERREEAGAGAESTPAASA